MSANTIDSKSLIISSFDDDFTLKDVSKKTGISTSQAYKSCKFLVEKGYLNCFLETNLDTGKIKKIYRKTNKVYKCNIVKFIPFRHWMDKVFYGDYEKEIVGTIINGNVHKRFK